MTPAGTRPAVLFDIDGTLVDSNYLHVYAWCRAFHEADVEVEASDVLELEEATPPGDVDGASSTKPPLRTRVSASDPGEIP